MISIVTINYNNADGLERTIQSVINQTYGQFEYVVIDGDSNDGSKEVIERYKDKIDFALSEGDSGIYNAMNKGIRASKGTYLLFLNSGDTLVDPNILQEVSQHLGENDDIYYGDLQYLSKDQKKREVFPKQLSFKFFYEYSLPHPASFIKRDLFDRIFYYNEDLKIVSDWEFFMVAVCKHGATYKHIDVVVSDFEVDGISWNPANKKALEEERRSCLEQHFPLMLADTKQLIAQEKLLKTNRFTLLQKLEKTKTGKKMGSLFLKLLTQFFGR